MSELQDFLKPVERQHKTRNTVIAAEITDELYPELQSQVKDRARRIYAGFQIIMEACVIIDTAVKDGMDEETPNV